MRNWIDRLQACTFDYRVSNFPIFQTVGSSGGFNAVVGESRVAKMELFRDEFNRLIS